jgi:hypothetical protein
MKIRITSTIDTEAILASRGLGKSHEASKKLASIVKTYCDPYVPFDTGIMKNTACIVDDGSGVYLVNNQPYAHYQYKGEVMGPNVLTKLGWRSMAKKGGKKYTGRPIDYHDAPMRGKEWDKRMMADRGEDVATALAAAIGGKRK